MRVIWATSVALSLGARSAQTVPTCQDIMSAEDAPSFCLQNLSDEIVGFQLYNQEPASYWSAFRSGSLEGHDRPDLAPRIGYLTANQLEHRQWLCIVKDDLEAGKVTLTQKPISDSVRMQFSLTRTPSGPSGAYQDVVCIHR